MLIGGYLYNKALNEWITQVVSGYMLGLVDDVAYDLQEKKLDLNTMTDSEIDAFLDSLSQANSESRFTLIDSSGKVLGDSQVNLMELKKLDDHSNRPEVVNALNSDQGISERYSATIGQSMLYVAKKLKLPPSKTGATKDYVLRLATPMTAVTSLARSLQVIVIAMMVSSLLILIFFSWYSHRKTMQFVDEERSYQDERIRQRTKEIELLHRLANMLAACNSIKEAQHVVADIIPRILGNINGCVSIIRESRNQLEVQLDWGGEWPASKLYAPHECWALRKGRHHLSHDEYHHLPCGHMIGCEEEGQTLCIPLTAHGNTVGMFHLFFGNNVELASYETKQLAFTIAEHLGLALANLNLQEKLRSQAMSDPLTGLFNRRYFEEAFDNEWLQAEDNGHPLSILMLDLDHFKRFNDNYGHDAGDYVLKEVSNLLQRSIGESHVACRLGGEELAVISPNASIEESMTLANKLVKEVRDLHLELNGLSLGQLGVSIGVATYPDLLTQPQALIKAADTALYQAKAQGRNRAVHTSDVDEHATTGQKKQDALVTGSFESDNIERLASPNNKS